MKRELSFNLKEHSLMFAHIVAYSSISKKSCYRKSNMGIFYNIIEVWKFMSKESILNGYILCWDMKFNSYAFYEIEIASKPDSMTGYGFPDLNRIHKLILSASISSEIKYMLKERRTVKLKSYY